MARIFIIGVTGGIGHRLAPLLLANGHQVTGLHRKPEQADNLRNAGITPVLGDLMELTAETLAPLIRGHDIVVFSSGAAGSGLDRTTRIDGDGPGHVVAAMKQEGISRLYLVSAFPEAGRGRDPNPRFEHYMTEKKRADADVAASDADWVILRPGTLLHEDQDGRVNAGFAIPYGTVKRGNVAQFLAKLIETPEIRREILELTDGGTEISEAVNRIVRK